MLLVVFLVFYYLYRNAHFCAYLPNTVTKMFYTWHKFFVIVDRLPLTLQQTSHSWKINIVHLICTCRFRKMPLSSHSNNIFTYFYTIPHTRRCLPGVREKILSQGGLKSGAELVLLKQLQDTLSTLYTLKLALPSFERSSLLPTISHVTVCGRCHYGPEQGPHAHSGMLQCVSCPQVAHVGCVEDGRVGMMGEGGTWMCPTCIQLREGGEKRIDELNGKKLD